MSVWLAAISSYVTHCASHCLVGVLEVLPLYPLNIERTWWCRIIQRQRTAMGHSAWDIKFVHIISCSAGGRSKQLHGKIVHVLLLHTLISTQSSRDVYSGLQIVIDTISLFWRLHGRFGQGSLFWVGHAGFRQESERIQECVAAARRVIPIDPAIRSCWVAGLGCRRLESAVVAAGSARTAFGGKIAPPVLCRPLYLLHTTLMQV